ncbi:MAG: HlyD family efflux transporter periplasmic adaptor subunit [Pseudomonadota bacterium]|nr:HlyD family efflux transporter periplasmic adaptor subunit [Pseudomonadota bacterium]
MTGARKLSLALLLLLAACNEHHDSFQGYAEGEYVYVASPIAGRLDDLAVHRGEQVKEDAPLFSLESQDETEAVRQAKAQLADLKTGKRPPEIGVLEAQLAQAKTNEQLSATQLKRDEKQYAIGAIARAQLDASESAHQRDAARVSELKDQLKVGKLPARKEQIRAAEAALAQAKWRLDQKSVRATQAGLVFDTLYVQGEWVPAGSPVVSLLPPKNIKVRFFVPETEVGALKTGEAVTVHCDGCAAEVPAKISYISPQAEYTPPVIYSNTTRSKLVFMVEARPSLEDAPKLHPGQPLEVRLDAGR